MVYFVHEFRPYLLGKRFILRTDHSALTWLMSFKEPTGQVARWIQKLQEYQFSIQYRSNLAHRNADALSRRPHRRHGECPSCTTETTVSTIQWPFTSTSDDLLISQQTYHPTATVINWLYTKQTNPQSAQDRNLQKYVQHYSAFQLIDGLLHIKKMMIPIGDSFFLPHGGTQPFINIMITQQEGTTENMQLTSRSNLVTGGLE